MFQNSGYVFSMTNAENNQIVVYARNMDGTLRLMQTYRTGGKGTGIQVTDPLMSQGSLLLLPDRQLLFAVNAGDNTVSSFFITRTGELLLQDIVYSGGVFPTCLAMGDDVLYVGNNGDQNSQIKSNIAGFQISCNGKLCHLPCITHSLSHPYARVACMVYSPAEQVLAVSELNFNRITVFSIGCSQELTNMTVNASNGAGPFGSAFQKNGVLLVTEAGAGALSSYMVMQQNDIAVISGSVTNAQSATCWISLNKQQTVAYTSNAGTDTISIYDITQQGSLTLRKNVLSDPNGTAAPLDSAVSEDGRNLYVLNGNEGSISVFQITDQGDLLLLQVLQDTGLPAIGAQGIAAL